MQVHRPPGSHPVALQLWNTSQRIGDVFDSYLAEAGGTRYQFFVFVAVDRLERPNQRQIAEAVGVDDATITHHLSAMERDGLIERARDLADRRVQRVALTPAGTQLWRRLNEAVDQYNEDLLGGIEPAQLEALATVLIAIDDNVESMLTDGAVTGHS